MYSSPGIPSTGVAPSPVLKNTASNWALKIGSFEIVAKFHASVKLDPEAPDHFDLGQRNFCEAPASR